MNPNKINNFVWINDEIILAIHEAQLKMHGGLLGVRDLIMLQSALARPKQLATYENPDVFDLAAAYGFGLSRNHPFLDGNKRTAFVATGLFLHLNGWKLLANHSDCVLTMLRVSEGSLTETDFAAWLKKYAKIKKA